MYSLWFVTWWLYKDVESVKVVGCNLLGQQIKLHCSYSVWSSVKIKTWCDDTDSVHVCMAAAHNIDVIILLTFLSGRLNRNSRSKRPGLLSAGSIESSLFVAPMTTISPRLSKPSIKASRVETIELGRGKKGDVTDYYTFNVTLSSKISIHSRL